MSWGKISVVDRSMEQFDGLNAGQLMDFGHVNAMMLE
jgi:hypothetical protein